MISVLFLLNLKNLIYKLGNLWKCFSSSFYLHYSFFHLTMMKMLSYPTSASTNKPIKNEVNLYLHVINDGLEEPPKSTALFLHNRLHFLQEATLIVEAVRRSPQSVWKDPAREIGIGM